MGTFDGNAYQARIDAMAVGGIDVHGEAALVRTFGPASVLDAGCGTGRVAIELARHGIDVVGVDADPSMLTVARRRAPHLAWIEQDLADLDLHRTFDVVLLAGNVPLFCPIATRPALIAACAAHVGPGGRMIAGFQLDRDYDLAEYDAGCTEADLTLEARWSTWDQDPYVEGGAYAVSVHRR
jgi:2-polyprenyl-3-methyl-5-hydroxy-6-metoxy-1,4-benzoquinol methylase